MKLVGEFESGVLVYEYKEDVYIIVNVEEQETKVSRSWYPLTRFLEIVSLNGRSDKDNEALEIIKNSNIIEQYNAMIEKENKKFERYGKEWEDDERTNRENMKRLQDELIKQNNIK